jgi:[ribosomal protein S5]-alanine N-acetyltransferase
MQLETPRLLLKPITPSLIHEMFNSWIKEDIYGYFGFGDSDYEHYKTMHEKGMETHRISLYAFVLVRKSDNLPIGECGFHTWNRSHRRTELFYHLRKDEYKRQGLMTEALGAVLTFGFTELGLHRVEAKAAPENTASIALLKKYDFTYEGIAREDYEVDGKNEDSVQYSLLKHEFKQL